MLKGGLVLVWELDMNLELTLLNRDKNSIRMKSKLIAMTVLFKGKLFNSLIEV